jgi:hypothetical protein
MPERYRKLAAAFAEAIVSQDYEAAHGLFAPWLSAAVSADDLEDRVQTAIDEVSEIIGLTGSAHPGSFSVTPVDASLDELRAPRPFDPPRAIAPEVTPETYRAWMKVQFVPGPDSSVEIDAWFDVWLALAETDDGLAIGYVEVVDAD